MNFANFLRIVFVLGTIQSFFLGSGLSSGSFIVGEFARISTQNFSSLSYFLFADSIFYVEMLRGLTIQGGLFTGFTEEGIFRGRNFPWGSLSKGKFSRVNFLQEQISQRGGDL